MKHLVPALFLFLIALPLTAAEPQDERVVKAKLVDEFMTLLDVKQLTRSTFDVMFEQSMKMATEAQAKMTDAAQREKFAAEQKQSAELFAKMRDRLMTRLDFEKYAKEAYAPLIDKTFTADQLRELNAFYRTKTGQRYLQIMPDMFFGSLARGQQLMADEMKKITEEMQAEEDAKKPWQKAMREMEQIAGALALDSKGEYPETLQHVRATTPLPEKDPWGEPYAYVRSDDHKHFRIISGGADHKIDWDSRKIVVDPRAAESDVIPDATLTPGNDADLIMQDWNFIQLPAASKQ